MNEPSCQPPAHLAIVSDDGGDTSCEISADMLGNLVAETVA
jgi:hypothetical protein